MDVSGWRRRGEQTLFCIEGSAIFILKSCLIVAKKEKNIANSQTIWINYIEKKYSVTFNFLNGLGNKSFPIRFGGIRTRKISPFSLMAFLSYRTSGLIANILRSIIATVTVACLVAARNAWEMASTSKFQTFFYQGVRFWAMQLRHKVRRRTVTRQHTSSNKLKRCGTIFCCPLLEDNDVIFSLPKYGRYLDF